MAANNYQVNYDDKRFAQVESDKKQAMTEMNNTYSDMINQSDNYYQDQINASKQWADKQSQLQQEQTDFAIDKIEQQKAQAQKDYTKEQSGAYVDWQKQSNQYGANAEKQAATGMTGTGFSESSQVSMYNTYQNRVATAREVFAQATLNYDNAMKDARLQNNARLAEIALEAYIKQTELALQGFQYKNTLVIEQANKKLEVDNLFYNRYKDVLAQINQENALAEEIRQYNEKMSEEKRQYNETLSLQKAQLAEEQRQFNEQMAYQKSKSSSSGGSSKSSDSSKSSGDYTYITKDSSDHAEAKAPVVKNGSGGHAPAKAPTVNNPAKAPTEKKADTNNMESIMALGYGPISEVELASLLASGEVRRTLKNGQYYYYRNYDALSSMNRLKNMGLSY